MMNIVFLILLHDQPALAARLVGRLLEEGAQVVVHLDANTPDSYIGQLHEQLGARFERIVWAQRVAVQWGKWSMVEASLNGLQAIRDAGLEPDYVYLLSGADYPLRPLEQLRSFLAQAAGTDFIESVDARREKWVKNGPQKARYHYRHWVSWKSHPRLYSWSIHIQRTLGLQRRFPKGLHPHIGSQWWTLTWETCRKVLDMSEDNSLTGFFRLTSIPDELYFQTLVRKIRQDSWYRPTASDTV